MLFFALSLLLGTGYAQYKAVATFTNAESNILGTVELTGGKLTVNLNLNAISNANMQTVFNNNSATRAWCWPNGEIKYHIHNSWNTSATGTSSFLTQCGATPTGGHWDPWFACGGATGSSACQNKGGCISQTYSCSSATFPSNPSSCEIGDWSGKYGVAIVDQQTLMASKISAMSRWEADAKSLTGKSVVLHCGGGGPRFACAQFAVSMTGGMAKPMMSYDYSTRYVADFGSIGGPQVYFGGSTIQYSNMFSCPSNTVASVMIYNLWNAPNMMALSGSTMCVKAKVGMVYDPYFSCVMGSEKTTECGYDTTAMKSTRCATQFDYAANCAMSPYYCAAGDITGRVSVPTATGVQNVTDYLLPMMTTGSVVVKCGTEMWCAKIRKADMSYIADIQPTSASSLTVISTGAFLAVMTFFAAN